MEWRGKAEALRQAKLNLLASDEGRDPRLWAAFMLTGEADQPVRISGPSLFHRYRNPLMVIAVTAALVVIGLLLLRRRVRRL
jgi:hypothetical protein